jgi:hypothetical protein
VPVPAPRDPARSLSYVLGVGDGVGVGMREHLLLKTVLGLPDLAVCVTQRLLAHDPQYVESRGAERLWSRRQHDSQDRPQRRPALLLIPLGVLTPPRTRHRVARSLDRRGRTPEGVQRRTAPASEMETGPSYLWDPPGQEVSDRGRGAMYTTSGSCWRAEVAAGVEPASLVSEPEPDEVASRYRR